MPYRDLIDSHCHLDDPRNVSASSDLLDAAFEAGVETVIIPGTSPMEWETLERLVQRGHPRTRLFACFGIHPQVVPELSEQELSEGLSRLQSLAAQGVAVGECGLDGPSTALSGGDIERQEAVLEAQLDIARTHRLPVVLHCLQAHPRMLSVLRRRGGLPHGGVMHSYSGSAELVRDYLALNCHFSFAGPVTYPGARKPLLALKAVPLDRLLIETDAPDQTPMPHKGPGRLNQSAYLPAILEAMAASLNLAPELLGAQTALNTRKLFRLMVGDEYE